jgi:uncharacterized protein YqeY
MGTLAREIEQRIRGAMKAGQAAELSTLRLIKTELSAKRVELKVADVAALEDDVVLAVLRGMVKKRENAIELFEQGGRKDLADKDRAEIAFLQSFLPQELSEDELRALAREVIAEVGAQGPREMGKVMAALKGRPGVNAGAASRIVKELLTPGAK